jgi:endonuclease/exonuclease/phosphatase family metal-dependent hydrolase
LNVLTYNIAGARGHRRGNHLEEIAALIRDVDADLVGLQEVIHPEGDHHPPDIRLAELTGMHSCFLPAHSGKGHMLGNAVLCREPISETISLDLPHPWPERRVLLEVTTALDGLPIRVFCTHLVHLARAAARIRGAQVAAVAQRMEACAEPHLLVGDLNAGPHSRELRRVREWCETAAHLTGLRSWPARRPLVLFDHIWPGPGWEVRRAEVLPSHASDHRPLLAELRWNGPHPARSRP